MNSALFEEVPRWQRWLRSGAFIGSVGFHAVAALFLFTSRPEAKEAEHWVEMEVVQPPPPEAKPPPPEPEPEPEKPKPVKMEETVPPPEQAPPPPKAPIRMAQGLSASSFAPGSGTSFDARAGTTTMMKAGDTMTLDEATGKPCTDAPVAPKLRVKPMMEVPEAAQKAAVEGQVTVLVDIDIEGKVTAVTVQKGLGYGTEDACVAAWTKARYRPATRCGTPVPMVGVPQRCTVDAIE